MDTHSIEHWVGPRTSLDVFLQNRKKSLASVGIRTPDRPARSLVTIPTTQSCQHDHCLMTSLGYIKKLNHSVEISQENGKPLCSVQAAQ